MESVLNKNNAVHIGNDVFNSIDALISLGGYSSLFILTDENVNQFCLPVLLEKCESLKAGFVIEIPAGEEEKNITTVAKIISILLENNADRKCLLINLGGGVISDIGGFTASIYKRGISFINIPTTLLSMVDASIGGKNGINFLERKNIIGAFNNPDAVYITPDFLKTLSKREVRAGYAEIIKHVLLSDELKWIKLKEDSVAYFDVKNYNELILQSVSFKSKISGEDFKEEGKRKILNFGHTLGHAIESFSLQTNEPLKHGEAIAAGMIGELYLSNRLAGFPEREMISAIRLFKNIFNDVSLNFSAEDLIPFLYADKKNSGDKISFSLLKSPGIPAGIFHPNIELIVESLFFMNEEFSRTAVQ